MRMLRFSGLLWVLFFFLLVPLSAEAHVSLKASVPAASAQLTAPPEAITLTFSGPVEQRFGRFTLQTPSGESLSLSATEAAGIANSILLILPELATGAYVLHWRVVAGDGHPLQGKLTFTYAP
jgi:copper resistance protein C